MHRLSKPLDLNISYKISDPLFECLDLEILWVGIDSSVASVGSFSNRTLISSMLNRLKTKSYETKTKTKKQKQKQSRFKHSDTQKLTKNLEGLLTISIQKSSHPKLLRAVQKNN